MMSVGACDVAVMVQCVVGIVTCVRHWRAVSRELGFFSMASIAL